MASLDIPDHRRISKLHGINGRLGNKSTPQPFRWPGFPLRQFGHGFLPKLEITHRPRSLPLGMWMAVRDHSHDPEHAPASLVHARTWTVADLLVIRP